MVSENRIVSSMGEGVLWQDVSITTPLVTFTHGFLTVGLPMLLLILLAGDVGQHRITLALWWLGALWVLISIWAFYVGIRTEIRGTKITIIKKLGPFQSAKTIDIREIQELFVPSYTSKLKAVLRSGEGIIIANKYAFTKTPLPDVEIGSEVRWNTIKTILGIKELLNERKRSSLR